MAGFLVRNFLLDTHAACRGAPLALLPLAGRWQTVAALTRRLDGLGDRNPAATLRALVDSGVLVPEGSAVARREREWLRAWKWGPLAAAFHRSLRDLRFRTEEQTAELL